MFEQDRKKQKKKSWASAWSYIIVPMLFCAISCGALYLAAAPMVVPYLGVAQHLFTKEEPHQASNLYENLAHSIENSTLVPFSQMVYPKKGDQYGKIVIDGTSVDAPLYYGDSTYELNRGAATYADSIGAGIPGENKTILLAAHNNTFFSGLQDVKEGDLIKISTHYGEYVYEVTEMKIADYTDTTTYDFSKEEENLILYTCYPFDTLVFTPQRYFVYADYVSGPMIDKSK